ncbi:RCC1 and BTB domain-containing protein 2 [Hondaea fermentalgiana]|uniref:RCC1 and BTB domain-containing protein 2 n=1 Tax=Hondaea fermentalgiana TaxID=2315210 RepID=A0A2R5GD75_9STRA|nr:RCC1 and BTB domain-containing protein 2 [Hondaea fermentalgiana]|eukprot:GBG27678.1 RCC1 and BTB domain-containing protein 2 [Hondaea fermentalgiana]
MQVYAWGRGEDGQLGLGDACDQYKPRLIESLSEKKVSSVVCGSGHTVVLSRDGEVFTWGRGDDGRLGHGDQGWKHEPRLVAAIKTKIVAQVTCGSYHTAAVTDAGELYTWGGGMYGKLGHGNENGHSIPRKVESLKDKCVVQVACGSRHTVVLVDNKNSQHAGHGDKEGTDVYAWGDRDNGVSGHGDIEGHQYFPRKLKALERRNVCQIAACGFHTGAVTQEGQVFTWGEGKFGRLGHGTESNQLEPRLIECDKIKDRRVVQIACGGFHTAAITDKGELFTWGGGEHGQLGHGNKENYPRPTRVKAMTKMPIQQVTCGWSHTVVLDEEGCVWTFGNGDHGKLGHGDTEKVIVPQKVDGLSNKRIVRVASYNEHTAALAVPIDQERKDIPNSTLVQDYRAAVNQREFSDVCFIVEGRRIYAHRVIVAARCAHFRAMFSSGMKESHEKDIVISDTRHDVFLALLYFLYTDCVDVAAEVAIELYVLADLYALDRLKCECEAISCAKLCQSNAPELLRIADQHQAHELKQICINYIVRHFEVISKMQEFTVLERDLIFDILKAR